FFFSSRRRHTRFSRDWSSDVWSSDLLADRQHLADSPEVPWQRCVPGFLQQPCSPRVAEGPGTHHLPMSPAYRRKPPEKPKTRKQDMSTVADIINSMQSKFNPSAAAGLRSEEHTSEL